MNILKLLLIFVSYVPLMIILVLIMPLIIIGIFANVILNFISSLLTGMTEEVERIIEHER
jgi:hypothetical protein